MGSADSLRGLVARELAGHSESWARRFLDPDTGQAHADVVDALSRLGMGLERDAIGDPLTEDGLLEDLAAWLASVGVVHPDDARNAERPRFQTGVRMQFEDRGVPAPSARAMDALAEIALGASEQSHPRAMRIATPELVVGEYLRGSSATPYVSVIAEAVEIATPAPVARPRTPKPRAQKPRAKAAKRSAPARRRRATTTASKTKRAATSKKKLPKRVAPRRSKARAAARARTKTTARTRKRTVGAKKARRKKK